MAVYVMMIKEMENDKKVVYKFGPNEDKLGEIEFDKKTRKFEIAEKVDDDNISNEAYERWAAERIVRVVAREDGKFPERMSVEK
ncbi:hypothetical protein [Listeria rustica]|uniref:Uncharacterized protein n=1 Tax=Listeria rustica TaxID=2713503 RepID=A0A7W1YFL1_9LIST|nr:hypothetical protein [Listeria rustica]MBA3925684.1 hypothetical protein [Listeria rustica]